MRPFGAALPAKRALETFAWNGTSRVRPVGSEPPVAPPRGARLERTTVPWLAVSN
ncbi:MAG TPA: hypothetical protein VMI54_14755 [Polyangiaceae bacterium]|nr:hypothetical protein [Polyangiaceae bacterium]